MVPPNISRQAIVCLLLLLTHAISTMAQECQKDTVHATYYADSFHGKRTSNGETYNKDSLTCAHRKLPFGTIVKVTNLQNGCSTTVRVNDRGPFGKAKIDLSRAAAKELEMLQIGIIKVEIEIISNSQNNTNEKEFRDLVRTSRMDTKER